MATNAFNIRYSTDYHPSQSTGPALALAPDPAGTPGAQELQPMPSSDRYGHPQLLELLEAIAALGVTAQELADGWAEVQQLRKPEYRQPLIAVAKARRQRINAA